MTQDRSLRDTDDLPAIVPVARKERSAEMPLIQLSLIKGVFSPEQKQQMISRLTDAMVSVEGENMRSVTWVKIDEIESGDWAVGGQALTTEAVKALAAGKTPVATG